MITNEAICHLITATAALLPTAPWIGPVFENAPPDGNIVPLRVYLVLGDSDTFGQNINVGCRWTSEEIVNVLNALVTNAPTLFGTNNHFWWGGILQIVYITQDVHPGYPGDPFREWVDHRSVMDHIVFEQWEWSQTHLNIYLFGNLLIPDSNGGPIFLLGWDIDPGEPSYPFIALGDGGYDSPSGSDADYSIATHVLEHEMAHHLLRLHDQAPYNYDYYEHVPPGSYNILSAADPVWPVVPPLHLPNAIPHYEQGTCAYRLVDGIAWRLP